MVVRELITKLGYRVDETQLTKYQKSATVVAQRMGNIGRKMTTFVTLPILGAGAAMTKLASDAAETESKFRTVFRDVEADADRAAERLVNSFGLSNKAAQQMLGDTGDLLTGFGFTGKAALDLSKRVNELAVDLESFTNFSGGAAGASAALTKALLGERESLKSLGIAILEKDVKAEVARMRAEGQRFESERQAKAYATMNIAIRQSKNAIGDFARTQHKLAGRTRVLRGRLHNMAVEFGKILIPVANRLVRILTKIIERLTAMPKWMKITVIVIGAILALVGPLLMAGSALIGMTTWAIANSVALNAALALTAGLLGSILAFLYGIILPAAIILLIVQDIATWLQGGESVFGSFVGPVELFMDNVVFWLDRIKTWFSTTWENIVGSVTGFFDSVMGWVDKIVGFFSGIGGKIAGILGFDTEINASGGAAAFAGAGGAGNTTIVQGGDVNVTVPPGTTAEQAEDIAGAVSRAVNESLTTQSRRVVKSNPVNE